jgi:hypothetical protein
MQGLCFSLMCDAGSTGVQQGRNKILTPKCGSFEVKEFGVNAPYTNLCEA